MTAVATRQPAAPSQEAGSAEPRRGRLFEPKGPTLEDSILAVWDQLIVDGRAECPLCGSSIAAAGGCETCGAELS